MLFEGLKLGVQLSVQNDRWMSEVWQVQTAGHSLKGPDTQKKCGKMVKGKV